MDDVREIEQIISKDRGFDLGELISKKQEEN